MKLRIRGVVYCDDVAIDAAMAGMCLRKPAATEQRMVESAIKVSKFRP